MHGTSVHDATRGGQHLLSPWYTAYARYHRAVTAGDPRVAATARILVVVGPATYFPATYRMLLNSRIEG